MVTDYTRHYLTVLPVQDINLGGKQASTPIILIQIIWADLGSTDYWFRQALWASSHCDMYHKQMIKSLRDD